MEVQRRRPAAARRGAGLPRPDPDHRGADRALADPPQGCSARCWARLRGRPPPPPPRSAAIAIEGAQTKGSAATDAALGARGLRQVPRAARRRRHHLAIVLWLAGLYLRPDFWGALDNSFNLMLAFTEIALLSIGLTYVIANGDIDLSVGAVLALSGADRGLLR